LDKTELSGQGRPVGGCGGIEPRCLGLDAEPGGARFGALAQGVLGQLRQACETDGINLRNRLPRLPWQRIELQPECAGSLRQIERGCMTCKRP